MNSMIVADWGQTRTIAMQKTETYSWSNPDGSGGTINGGQPRYTEMNPFLGEHPSVGKVNWYFAGSLLVNNTIYFSLPLKYRNFYAIGVGVYQAYFVINNHRAGIEIRF